VTAVAVVSRSVSEAAQPAPAAALNLQADDFTLFGLPPGFAMDRAVLDERWKQLQRQAHPDRFTTQGSAAQRVAMQWSVRINEAYRRLRDPLQRAAYLCELAGHPVRAEDNTAMPPAFLMQQMQWREALDEADDAGSVGALQQQTEAASADWLQQVARALDQDQDAQVAVQAVRALMFVERFRSEIEARLDQLGQ